MNMINIFFYFVFDRKGKNIPIEPTNSSSCPVKMNEQYLEFGEVWAKKIYYFHR